MGKFSQNQTDALPKITTTLLKLIHYPKFGENYFSGKFELSCLPRDNLSTRRGIFSGLSSGRELYKTVFWNVVARITA
jgi:hypothetical protein